MPFAPFIRIKSSPASGLSIVEMLVGIAVGMFVLAGATLVTSSQLSDNRQLILETQIQQDLRATADVITRELRRSGYWNNATATVWGPSGASAPINAFQTFSQTGNPGVVDNVTFSYSKQNVVSAPVANAPNGDEQFGYRLNAIDKTIEAKVGGAGWQTLTDPNVVLITQFDLDPRTEVSVVPCAKSCVGGGTACWPQMLSVNVNISISGQATHDAKVKRSVQSGVRIRNDQITGVCPE